MLIEKTVLDYLSGVLDVPVSLEEPESPPERMVIIQKTGSTKEHFITTSIIAVQSYAASLYDAALLNEEIKEKLQGIVAIDGVTRCELNSDYEYTDTTYKRYRYQAVFDITHY